MGVLGFARLGNDWADRPYLIGLAYLSAIGRQLPNRLIWTDWATVRADGWRSAAVAAP